MADVLTDRPQADPPAPPPTPLQGFTSSLGILQDAGTREADAFRTSAQNRRAEVADLRGLTDTQDVERKAAIPKPPTLPNAPDVSARPFLTPGPGVMNQLQTMLTGITGMVMGVGGLRGNGHAIAAVAALKGALEGWQEGDRERAKNEITNWKTHSDKLQQDYFNRLESYQTILTDQKRAFSERLAEIGIKARIDQDEEMARAAERQNIGEIIKLASDREIKVREFGLRTAELQNSIAQHHETSARLERDHKDLERQRAVLNDLARQRLQHQKDNSATILKLEKEDDSITGTLRQMTTLEDSVKRMYEKGVIPKGATVADKALAATKLQTRFGDEELAADIENVKKMGTAMLVGSEVAAGLAPSVARLKVVGDAEAAGAAALPKSFWDAWFVRQRETLATRQSTVRSHLKTRATMGREAPGEGGESESDDPLGIK